MKNLLILPLLLSVAVAVSASDLLLCEFENHSTCGLKIRHPGNAFFGSGENGKNHMSFRVKPGQKAEIELPDLIPAWGEEKCIWVEERHGTVNANETPKGKLEIVVVPEGSNFEMVRRRKNTSATDFLPTMFNIDKDFGFKDKMLRVTVKLEVPEDGSEQFFDVRKVYVAAGSCPQ